MLSEDTKDTHSRVSWLMGVLSILLSAAVIGWVSQVEKKLENLNKMNYQLGSIEVKLGLISNGMDKMQADIETLKDRRYRWKR